MRPPPPARGHPYRYGYAMQTSLAGGDAGDSVLNHDLHRPSPPLGDSTSTARRRLRLRPHHRTDRRGRGSAGGFVYNAATDRSDLDILDA
ncbi:MAG: hypothetical protein M3319_07585, partial [Actinomycetota bacterium]|nr:hypothetical protein [Actinomycetota bacterium]